jgi:sugar (pentulose or hexulose) kinase
MAETVAVLDVGKSNVKLSLVDADERVVLTSRTTPNRVRTDGPYPHFDLDGLWTWFIEGLRGFSATRRIDAIVTTTHGACFVVVAGDQPALPVLDYEFAGPDTISAEYDAVRGGFRETLSPSLPGGLNAGRQLFWLSRAFPTDFARADAILPYPQYWVMRLTGRKVSEVTSFGAHTDLWNPRAAGFSRLAEDQGWAALVPPAVRPWETVGAVLPAVAREAGLEPGCRVLAGIHDSNAALLPHLLGRPLPFALLSTGTWMITFAPGGSLDRLDPARDCLANVDAFGRPVPSAMCMAGREFEILTEGADALPTLADVQHVVSSGIMALPSLVAGSGPFPRLAGGWSTEPKALSPEMRVAAASLYAALVADTCLELTGAAGPILVEGPFARNNVFLGALARLTGRSVLARPDAAGTTLGAALLALGGKAAPVAEMDRAEPIAVDLAAYAAEWRERAEPVDVE